MSPRVAVGAVFTACFLALAAPAAQAAGKAECANTDLVPAEDNLAEVRAAVLCLHNEVRAERGLPKLKENGKLRKAAERHSDDMVKKRFFAHESSNGDLKKRVLRTGYARNQRWTIGENIAWGTDVLATPREIHKAWMRSPGHKANILRREFREIGIGVALGAPIDEKGLDAATYTTDFGARH